MIVTVAQVLDPLRLQLGDAELRRELLRYLRDLEGEGNRSGKRTNGKAACVTCGRTELKIKDGRFPRHQRKDGAGVCTQSGEVTEGAVKVTPPKRISLKGPRAKMWDNLKPRLEVIFATNGLVDTCEARISRFCTGQGEYFLHGRKRNKDHHIGPLTSFVIRGCRHCGLHVDEEMKPTEMFDFIWEKIQKRGWMPFYNWRDGCINLYDPPEYPVQIPWINSPADAPGYQGYEMEMSAGGMIPLDDSDDAVAAAKASGIGDSE